MNIVLVTLIVVVLLSIVVLYIDRRNKEKNSATELSKNELVYGKKEPKINSNDLIIKFNELPSLSVADERNLVEIKDSKLLGKIDNAIPGTLQAIANSMAIKGYHDKAKELGQLYQVIIPEGAKLDPSRAIDGAVRGSYRDVPNSIKGNANWMPVDNDAADGLAKMGAVDAVMNVAAMVVGQYFMAQINDSLENISAEIQKIADFQQKEFTSEIYVLVAEVHKSSTFQVETIENDEIRNRELINLKSLEHKCAQKLGHANLALQDISNKNDLSYDDYEKQINEADFWFQHQQILLKVMQKISELEYTLNLGKISKENSYALYLPYAKQSEDVLAKLNEWHTENVKRLEISVEDGRRKRQGINGFFMGALGIFNDNLNYKKLNENTVERIEQQLDVKTNMVESNSIDLYQKDVRLIAKDGKLYYLPDNDNKTVGMS